jgi:hypothetical protein
MRSRTYLIEQAMMARRLAAGIGCPRATEDLHAYADRCDRERYALDVPEQQIFVST